MGDQHRYTSANRLQNYRLDLSYTIGGRAERTALDRWLVERYCLYVDAGALYRYDIHHLEWGLHELNLQYLDLHYQIGTLRLEEMPQLIHYSEGVKVLAWNKVETHDCASLG